MNTKSVIVNTTTDFGHHNIKMYSMKMDINLDKY